MVSLWVCITPCGGRGSVKAQGNELREKQSCAKEELRTGTFLSLYQKVAGMMFSSGLGLVPVL